MDKVELEYTNKEQLIAKGFVVKGGKLFRETLIERYYRKGWLEHGSRWIGAKTRLDCANRLAIDFYFSRFSSPAVDWQKERVDGGNSKGELSSVLDARDRFFKAIRSVPPEFWGTVQAVVLEEKRPKFLGTKKLNEYALYVHKVDLCRGLDRLAWHYGVKPVRKKIVAAKATEQPKTKTGKYLLVVNN